MVVLRLIAVLSPGGPMDVHPTLIETLAAGVVMLDAEGRVVAANGVARHCLGARCRPGVELSQLFDGEERFGTEVVAGLGSSGRVAARGLRVREIGRASCRGRGERSGGGV